MHWAMCFTAVTTGLVPVVHAELRWIAGTSPAMTMDGRGHGCPVFQGLRTLTIC